MRLIFWVFACVFSGAALAADPSQLSLGKIVVTASPVPEQRAKKVHLEAVIDASPDKVWAIVTDCANFKHTMPRTTKSVELSREGGVVVCQSTVDLTWPLPDLVGTTLDGDTFRLSDQLGDVVVINVWASWCAPCRAEAPTLAALAEELEPQGVSFVGLDTRDSDVSARAFVERFGITYPNVIDRDGQLQLLFSDSLPPQAIPSTLVVDREGRVAGRVLGKASESALRGLIEPLQAEASGGQ
jgi:thiol-disulfide isomerase/thioredoxin